MAYNVTWTEIQNTRFSDAYPDYILNAPLSYRTAAPWNAESGGCSDPVRRMFYSPIAGGHSDYYFNFVAGVHIPTSLVSPGWTILSHASLNLPEFIDGTAVTGGYILPRRSAGGESSPPSVPSPVSYSDGKPPSRHTYGSVQCSPTNNELWVFSGPRWQDAGQDTTVWRFQMNAGPSQNTWTTGAPGFHSPLPGFSTQYDILTNTTWGRDRSHLVGYNHTLQTWFRHSKTVATIGDRCTSVLDPVRDRYLIHRMVPSTGLGDTYARMASIDPEADEQLFSQFDFSGDYTVFNEQHPGWVYLSGIDKYVAWAGLGTGGADVTIMDPDTGFCTVVTGTGATLPGTDASHGSFGRFAAFGPNEIILANKTGENMWQLVITDDAPSGTSVDLVMQHADFTPTVATSVASYRYSIVTDPALSTVEIQFFADQQNRVTFPAIPDGDYFASAAAYDGLDAIIGTAVPGVPFTLPFSAGPVEKPVVHSVVVAGSSFVSVTVPNAPNLAMIAFTSGRISDNDVTSVRFDGADLTEKAFVGAGGSGSTAGRFLAAYYMLNPPVKTANVVATVAQGATTSCIESVVFVQNVHQTTPLGAAVTAANAASSAASTVTVPSEVNDLIITALTTGGASHVPGAGQTALFLNAVAAGQQLVRQGASTKPGEATETEMPWTFANWAGVNTVQIGFAIKGAGTPIPPAEDPVNRVVATAIAVVVGATLGVDVTYTSTPYPFDTEAVTLWQVHLVDVNGAVVGTSHENITQAAGVQARDLPLPSGFGSPYRVRARERNAESGTLINELFSSTFAVVPAGGPLSILVPTSITFTPIQVDGAPDNVRVSWTVASVEFPESVNAAAYTAMRVSVGALPPKVVTPAVQDVVFQRVLPGEYTIRVERYKTDTDEALQTVSIVRRHGNREVSL